MKIFIADTVHPVLIEKLKNAGCNCKYSPSIDNDNLAKNIHTFEGLIIRSKTKLDNATLKKATRLKFIGRVGAGMESIDVSFAQSMNIKCFNSPEGNRDAVGEHAIGMLLALFNKLCKANNEVKNGKWIREENRGIEIKDKTIGIIGYGNMGSAFAKKLKGFEVTVIAYDKYKSNYSDEYIKESSLEDIFKKTDILSLHVPLTDETMYMVNHSFIQKFKKPIYIINTARGKVVNTNDLVKNLASGKISGACLDVLEYESSSFETLVSSQASIKYLQENENVILSPHIAGWTTESNYKLSSILADKIIAAFC